MDLEKKFVNGKIFTTTSGFKGKTPYEVLKQKISG